MDLKALNVPVLGSILFINTAFSLAIVEGGSISNALESIVSLEADFVAPATGVIISGLVTNQLSALSKARIVFLRWRNPLPGSRAFSEIMHRDDRINVASLKGSLQEIPLTPEFQNAEWYKIFRSLQSDATVAQAHRSYLLYRDWCILCLAIWIGAGVYIAHTATAKLAITYSVIMFVQFLFARNAAANSGNRLVSTVLAIKSVE